jgi:hypothetical protein
MKRYLFFAAWTLLTGWRISPQGAECDRVAKALDAGDAMLPFGAGRAAEE